MPETSPRISLEFVVGEIRRRRNPAALPGMSRFGIETSKAFGVSLPELRRLSSAIRKNHDLAEQLWKTAFHEARLLAGMIDDPSKVSEAQMEEWAMDFDSWDIVDGTCGNLFDKTPFAVRKAHEWSHRPEEYVKRAGFVLMAELAVHDKKAADSIFLEFLPDIIRESVDGRNFVKKAVNWALRQIGKRNANLNLVAVKTAERIRKVDTRSAKWIANNALRELISGPVQEKLQATAKTVLKK
jgi:3-methyladenine DNA glycosylase AlkD